MNVMVTVNNDEDKKLWREAERLATKVDDWEEVKSIHASLRERFIRQEREEQKRKYHATH